MSQTAQALVDIIVRKTSNPNEQEAALNGLRRMVDKAGGVQILFGNGRGGASAPPPITSFNATRTAMRDLEDEITRLKTTISGYESRVSTLTVEVARLTEENTVLRSSMKKTITTKDDGSMPYRDFSYRVEQILGTQGWNAEFVRQTGIDLRVLTRARVNGTAPKELVDHLPALKTPTLHVFSPEEVRQLRLWSRRFSDHQLAEQATRHNFRGGVITTPALIRKLRTDLKMGNGIYGNDEYRDSDGSRVLRNATGRAVARPRFLWSEHPEVEDAVARRFIAGDSANDIAKYAAKATGHDISANQITQRVYNSLPPRSLITHVKTEGPLTWEEVWLIFKTISPGKTWMSDARRALGFPVEARAAEGRLGTPLDDISPEIVQSIRNRYFKRVGRWMA